MRRKPGTLLPIENSILEAAAHLEELGIKEFHGFQIAKEVRDLRGARFLTGYGTLYRALARLQQQGLLQSRWEEQLPIYENRPRRRYYRLVGKKAVAQSKLVQISAPENCKVWDLGASRA